MSLPRLGNQGKLRRAEEAQEGLQVAYMVVHFR